MQVSTRGTIVSSPRLVVTSDGRELATAKFSELVSLEDYRINQGLIDIVAFDELAHELIKSGKGSQILVSGDLRIQNWDNGERSGTVVEIEIVDLVPLELVGKYV